VSGWDFFQGTVPGGGGFAAGTEALGTDVTSTSARWLVSPQNPLFWFGALLLVTVGAAGVAGSVRLGPARVSGSVGKG
jgi:hypothetical protein